MLGLGRSAPQAQTQNQSRASHFASRSRLNNTKRTVKIKRTAWYVTIDCSRITRSTFIPCATGPPSPSTDVELRLVLPQDYPYYCHSLLSSPGELFPLFWLIFVAILFDVGECLPSHSLDLSMLQTPIAWF